MTLPIPTATFSATLPQDSSDFASTHYEYHALTRGLAFRQNQGWPLQVTGSLEHIPWVILAGATFNNSYQQRLYLHPSGAVIMAGLDSLKSFTAYVSASERSTVAAILSELHTLLPARPPVSDKEEVSVSFWSLGPHGARAMERTIGINPWDKVRPNYPTGTGTSLERLMVGFRPSKAGQLVLWYGPPGTGKTHALRALAWEWRKWCSFHYITDPEVFFGTSANYMLDVLLLQSSAPPRYTGPDDDDEGQDVTPFDKHWRLLILEDSGELMCPDAKTQTGQGLSRLLNVVDGLIGQGLRIMVLVTTNEVLKKLHPAVARPGRCAARIEFGEFTKTDAALWLANNGVDVPSGTFNLNTNVSLAEMYSLIGDDQTVHETKTQSVGFAG